MTDHRLTYQEARPYIDGVAELVDEVAGLRFEDGIDASSMATRLPVVSMAIVRSLDRMAPDSRVAHRWWAINLLAVAVMTLADAKEPGSR